MENVNVDISKKLMFTIILIEPESFLIAGDRFCLWQKALAIKFLKVL